MRGPPPPPRASAKHSASGPRVEPLEVRAVPAGGSLDLGVAEPYNVFVSGDFNASYSDVQGRLAVGGNATITGYGIGDQLGSTDGPTLVVGGDLNLSNGQVNFGDIVVGGTANIAQNVGIPQGSVISGMPIDFGAARDKLTAKSEEFSNLATTGSV